MSVTGLSSDPNKLYKIPYQWRKNSGELDVFEAARYFSGDNEHQIPGRMSLDNIATMRHSIPPQIHLSMDQKKLKEKNNNNHKKYRQPSSPGVKLASFLNSLFNQTTSKKKMKSKDVEEDSHGGRRKRRSSISHFRITTFTTNADVDDDCKSSLYSSSASGFRAPPPYANTPIKSYKEFRSFFDHKKVVSLPNCNGGDFLKSRLGSEQKAMELDCLVEEFRGKNGISEKISVGFEERGFRKLLIDVDDGVDSDSSSDLFDLPNHDLDFYPTSLPVYETTHMDRIKIETPIPTIFH